MKWRSSIAALMVCLGLWLAAPGVSPLKEPQSAASSANGVPVVVIVLDEFPVASIQSGPSRIDRRFRNFASLSRRGTWYRNALSVADKTVVALPAIVAGQRGQIETEPVGEEYPENLFTILGGAGYSISSHEEVTDLCPDRFCAPEGDRQRPRKVASEFISGLDRKRSRLSFVHLMLPHVPWRTLPDGKEYRAPLAPGLDLREGDKTVPWKVPQPRIDSAWQRQQLQLAYTDRQIGRIVRRMKDLGTWDRSLFVVVADHGSSFQRGLFRRHVDQANSGWMLPVPMFVKYPGQQGGGVDSRPADLLDVLPTVLDVAGIEPDNQLEGESLRADPPVRRKIEAVSTAEGMVTLDRRQVAESRDLVVGRRMSTFRRGSPWVMAGASGLIGRKVSDVGGLKKVRARLNRPWPRAELNRMGRTVPAYVNGAVKGRANGLKRLLVALNGRIVGSLKPWAKGGSKRFAFTLPPGPFRKGVNRVALYRAKG